MRGACDEARVKNIATNIMKAVKTAELADKDLFTVVKSQGPDEAKKKCVVIYRTRVPKGNHKKAAKAINSAEDIGKTTEKSERRLRFLAEDSAGVVVSASTTAEEVPSGAEPESTDFSKNGMGFDDEGEDDFNESLNSMATRPWPSQSFATIVACIAALLSVGGVL